jgi:ribosomal protein S2
MSRHQNARKNLAKVANRSSEGVAKFRYLGTTLTNQNIINEEIKSRLNPNNACYHSGENLLVFSSTV